MLSLPGKETRRSGILTHKIRIPQPRCRQKSSNWSTGAAERSSSTKFNSTMTFGLQVGSPPVENRLANGQN